MSASLQGRCHSKMLSGVFNISEHHSNFQLNKQAHYSKVFICFNLFFVARHLIHFKIKPIIHWHRNYVETLKLRNKTTKKTLWPLFIIFSIIYLSNCVKSYENEKTNKQGNNNNKNNRRRQKNPKLSLLINRLLQSRKRPHVQLWWEFLLNPACAYIIIILLTALYRRLYKRHF